MLLGAFLDDTRYLFVVRSRAKSTIRAGKRKSQIETLSPVVWSRNPEEANDVFGRRLREIPGAGLILRFHWPTVALSTL